MTQATHGITPLRQRMIDDMRMRKLTEKTQSHYLHAVRQFAGFVGRSPDTASVEELRRYQLHLVDHGVSPVSLNAAITGLKFFCEVTLGQPELMAKMQPVRVPRTLPVVVRPGGGGAADRRNEQPQTPDGTLRGLGCRAAGERGDRAQGRRHRQSAHDATHRAGERTQGSLRHAPAPIARAATHLVAGGAGPRQDARWGLAVSRQGLARVAHHAAAQSRRARRGAGGRDRQARVDAHAAALSTLPDYVL